MSHTVPQLPKRLNYRDVEIWTVHGGARVTDMEIGLRSILSHELVEQIRYRTREGMKTATRKGKVAGGLSYGYPLKAEYDASGNRIRGLREIDEEAAEVIRWIFAQYADGLSPSALAQELNRKGIPGPRGLKWRDTAIRGHVDRGTGILNNEAYRGRIIFNRRNFRKPETERREARMNAASEWVIADNPELRIIDDALWERVKMRQREVRDNFETTTTNRLNRTHRPSYLLSGILRCAECGGPYAIMGKDRYGCTNHNKKIPIDELDGKPCANRKTISRRELEDRVLTCVPNVLWNVVNIERVADEAKERLRVRQAQSAVNIPKIQAQIEAKRQQQKALLKQITERMVAGKPALSAPDEMVDDLETGIAELLSELETARRVEPREIDGEVTPEIVERVINAMLYYLREHADAATKQPFIEILRSLIQCVEIGPLSRRPGRGTDGLWPDRRHPRDDGSGQGDGGGVSDAQGV